MAATTTAFEYELRRATGLSAEDRGLMAGAVYRLRRVYMAGVTDPTAHQLAKINWRHVQALNANQMMASFNEITAP